MLMSIRDLQRSGEKEDKKDELERVILTALLVLPLIMAGGFGVDAHAGHESSATRIPTMKTHAP